MYNPYLTPSDPLPASSGENEQASGAPSGERNKKRGLSGLWKSLRLNELDTGDILLLLILLFLYLDDSTDNSELLITLGLMLIL